MKMELDEGLVKDFPNLYRDRNGDPRDTCMCWGFPRDGWEPLIRALSEKLEALILALPEEERSQYRAFQVKQKFGGLRFYMSKSTQEMKEVIDAFEAESFTTCEMCGAKAELTRSGGWLRVHCAPCEEAYQKDRKLGW